VGALLNRQFALNIGGVGIATSIVDPTRIHSTLRVAFRIERTSQKEPNPGEVTIWNLAKDSRTLIESAKLPLALSVGYSGFLFQIYSGDLTYAASQKQGVDWVTKIQLGDGAKQFKSARINTSLAAATPLSAAIQAASAALAVLPGNIGTHLSNIRPGAPQAFPKGIVLSGKAEEVLDKLLKSAGYEWSIQDGQLQVLAPTEPAPGAMAQLSADSGLVGAPERSDKGAVKGRCLIQPDILPGRLVSIVSFTVTGVFKVERVVFSGDSWGQDWYLDFDCRPI